MGNNEYGIVTKTVARGTLSGTRVRVGRGLGARAASVTPLRVFIPGMHVPILFLAPVLFFGCRHGFAFNRPRRADTLPLLRCCWLCSRRQVVRLNQAPVVSRRCLSAGLSHAYQSTIQQCELMNPALAALLIAAGVLCLTLPILDTD